MSAMESMDPTRELDAFAVDAAVRPLERPSKRPRTGGAGGGSDALYMGPGDTVTAELDVLAGFAHIAANSQAPFVKPTMLPAGCAGGRTRASVFSLQSDLDTLFCL